MLGRARPERPGGAGRHAPHHGICSPSSQLMKAPLRAIVAPFTPCSTRFAPTDDKVLDINEHLRLGLDGGLGMFLMRKVMDEVRYASTSRYTNELDMIKFLPSQEG